MKKDKLYCCPALGCLAVAAPSMAVASYKEALIMRKKGYSLISIIEHYQSHIDPSIKRRFHKQRICRYHPTCSEYTKEAIIKYGSLVGVLKGLARLIRCNPFSSGGYDPLR